MKIPDGIHLYCLPSHSPELQPAERLWPLTNEPIANRCFKNLDELEAVLFERCRKLLNLKQLISGSTYFYWWPEAKFNYGQSTGHDMTYCTCLSCTLLSIARARNPG